MLFFFTMKHMKDLKTVNFMPLHGENKAVPYPLNFESLSHGLQLKHDIIQKTGFFFNR
jgi:hypothetical protein